jgi:hypothetical protein
VEVSGSGAAAKMLAGMADAGGEPCLALMLGFEPGAAPLLPFDAASLRGSQHIAWVAMDSSKPVGGAPREAVGAAGAFGSGFRGGCRGLDAPARPNRPSNPRPVRSQGRAAPGGERTLVALATPAFSRHLAPRMPGGGLPPQTPELLAALAPALLDALQEALRAAGIALPRPAFAQAHRWASAAAVAAGVARGSGREGKTRACSGGRAPVP